ncbi:hypothetical protein OROHE_007298 [Orobanche hederae]
MCLPKEQGGMGFKRLAENNRALLGKQAWRFLTQPNALVTRVFKAKYFPHTSFLEEDIRHEPSYAWKSILSSKSVVAARLGRRIGNGDTTKIFTDPWLLTADSPYVSTIPSLQYLEAKVSDFMEPNSTWNEDLVKEVFDYKDANLILNTPISPEYDNTWYWRPDLRVQYTVRSSYNLQLSSRMDYQPNGPFDAWSTIWKLKVDPKVRNFIWRSLRNVLPVCSVLQRRAVDVGDGHCYICTSGEENLSHIFLHCPPVMAL